MYKVAYDNLTNFALRPIVLRHVFVEITINIQRAAISSCTRGIQTANRSTETHTSITSISTLIQALVPQKH